MSLSFKQIQDMLSTNLRLVGADIDSMRKEIAGLRLVVFQLLNNQGKMLDGLKEKGIEIKMEEIVEASQEAPKE